MKSYADVRPLLCSLLLVALFLQPLPAQDNGARKEKASRIRDLARRKTDALPAIEPYLKDSDPDVREEAVRAIIRIGGPESLGPLINATKDNSASVQIRAVDGLVNFYLPGYVPSGLTAPVTRGVRSAKSVVFTRNDQVINAGTPVRADVGEAVRDLIGGGATDEARREAARAAGILRNEVAVPALASSLRAKDSGLIFESLVALQKIKTHAEIPSLTSATHDLEERTQILALETVGVLRSTVSAPDVRSVLKNPRNLKVERAAIEALAMLGMTEDRAVFQQYARSSDPAMRASALEGLGRVRDPEDVATLDAAYNEANADWRVHLAAAFGIVEQGKLDTGDYSPLPYLVENASMKSRSTTATAYLAELVRRPDARKAMMPLIHHANRQGKLALCPVLGNTGEIDAEPVLQDLTRDPDADVATAASRALKTLRARQSS